MLAGSILVAAPCNAYDILLRWTVPPQPNVAGYRIYTGSASRLYAPPINLGSLPNVTVNGVVYYLQRNLPTGIGTYVAVTAYTTAGVESPYSNEQLFSPSNATPPIVDPGVDRTGTVGDTFTLGSRPAAGVTYFWEQTSGPAATLSKRTNSSTQFTAIAAGTYAFTLTARNKTGVAAQGTVTVVVIATSVGPTPTPISVGVPGYLTDTKSYAMLPAAPDAAMTGYVGSSSDVFGSVCAYTLQVLTSSHIVADLIGLKTTAWAIKLGRLASVDADVVSAGGRLIQAPSAHVGGIRNSDSQAPEVTGCQAAAARAASRRAALQGARAGMTLGSINVARDTILTLGPLGRERVVIDASEITVERGGSLVIVGGPLTNQVVVRVAGALKLKREASIVLSGTLNASQALFVVDGAVSTGARARLGGSVMAADTVTIGQGSIVNGQLLSDTHVQLRRFTIVNLEAFTGW